MNYIGEYYKGEDSEAGFSEDKIMLGWGIAQRRENRVDSALFIPLNKRCFILFR